MPDNCPNLVACASRSEEIAFVAASIEVWRARNIGRHSDEALGAAVRTVSEAFADFIDNSTQLEGWRPPLEGSSDVQRRVLGILVKLSLSLAGSGIAQASVHAGFTHSDRVSIIWQPDRYLALIRFTKAWTNELYAEVAALEGIDSARVRGTFH